MVSHPVLDLLTDPGRRADVLGEGVGLSRLRHKPGMSTVARIDGRAAWVTVFEAGHREKADKLARIAEESRLPVRFVTVGALQVASGPVGADRRLSRLLARHGRSGDRVVSYNPHRRLVVRRGDTAVRFSRHPQLDWREVTRGLPAGFVPLLSAHARRSTWQWIDGEPLHQCRDTAAALAAAGAAGAQAAALHASSVPHLPHWAGDGPLAAASMADRLIPGLGALAAVTPIVAWACAQASEGLVPSHGDLSADQVLVDASGRAWLNDLDRMCRAPAGLDAGTFVAVERLTGRDDLAADFCAGAGRPADERWVAHALALRLLDPLRDARPEWAELIAARLDQVVSTWSS